MSSYPEKGSCHAHSGMLTPLSSWRLLSRGQQQAVAAAGYSTCLNCSLGTLKDMDVRRSQAALSFLRHISLDGRPAYPGSGNVVESEGEVNTEAELDLDGGAPLRLDEAAVPSITSPRRDYQLSPESSFPDVSSAQRSQSSTLSRQTCQGSCSSSSARAVGLCREAKLSLDVERQRHQHVSQCPSSAVLGDIAETPPPHRFHDLTPSHTPPPRSSKRVHFIKNMRQHDTRNGRIVLISVKRALYGVFSILLYGDLGPIGNLRLDTGRQRYSTTSIGATETQIGLEYMEPGSLPAKGKTVSYTQLLHSTNALTGHSSTDTTTNSLEFSAAIHHRQGLVQSVHMHANTGAAARDFVYDPNLLDDPQWPCGKHKKVLVFSSYMTTVMEYVRPSDLKRDMNETFKAKFPHVQLTLSKIWSLKREIRKLAQEDCGYEEPTVAMALVYFEKLALCGKLDKQNRKLGAGACVLLAAKIGSDLKRHDIKLLIERLEERLRLNRRELLAFEFPALVALEFRLYLPHHELLPHYRRLLQMPPA